LVAGLDPLLETRGFTCEGPTDVMLADLEGPSADFDVEIGEEPGAEWLEVQRGLQGVSDGMVEAWGATIGRIRREAAFGLVREGSRPVAAGLGIRDETWLGLFEINVAASHRRRGIGRRLSRGLLAWGADGRARRAYLQVLADNDGAQALYRSLGFRKAYGYWYRRAPEAGF
jgi:ribosomal protein S18 acetylase RimI-like enzyme